VARYLIDANLPRWFSLWASGDCAFVHDLGADWSDTQIWDYAAANGLTIVTKDADFSDRAVLAGDAGPKVIHVRMGNLRIEELHQFLTAVWPDVCRTSDASRLVQVYRDRIESMG
jgi:predicted nuclease of predicted toxin-antitoxin system